MKESKIELTERLRREGRWAEASMFKDEAVKRLRAEGARRTEAADAAWAAMAEKFPPLPPSDPPAAPPDDEAGDDADDPITPAFPIEDADMDALLEKAGSAEPDLPEDVLWVYNNIENRMARPVDAPGSGAWSLLQWARGARNRFFEQLLPKALVVREKQEEAGPGPYAAGFVEDKGIQEIEQLLRSVTCGWTDGVPEAVRTEVRHIMASLKRQFGLTIPSPALDELVARLARMVQEGRNAIAPSGEAEGQG